MARQCYDLIFLILHQYKNYDTIHYYLSMAEENLDTNLQVKNGEYGNNKDTRRYLSTAWEFLKIVIFALIIVLPIRYFLFQPFIVKGESMVPNFQPGDYLIVDELSYRIRDIQRGDVIVLKYPLDMSQRFIKRIIGLPGETVDINNGIITISKDGKSTTLNEKAYLPNLLTTDGNVHITLSDDQYFVLGDNRQFSYDSRKWGALPKKILLAELYSEFYLFKHYHI